MKNLLLILGLLVFAKPAIAQDNMSSWPQGSQALLSQAIRHDPLSEDLKANTHLKPTSDGKSYILIWYKGDTPPSKWLVSLHGSNGFATRDLAIWAPSLAGRDMGFISLQWWLGTGDQTKDYYAPNEIYREIDKTMSSLGASAGNSMLVGFSRGSANVYAVAAMDNNRGRHYFPTIIASSGGAAMGYPPTAAINNGAFGKLPFSGTKWITACGEKDAEPERDGCPAMKKTGDWLKQMGGDIVLAIEDPNGGHGALNTNPLNAAESLDFFLKGPH